MKRNPENTRKHYLKNRSKRILSVALYQKRQRKAVIETLGGKCARCLFDDVRALQIDHVNGGGSKDAARAGKGGLFSNVVMRSVLNNEGKFQLLCANCNWIKRAINNELKRN